MGRPLNKRHFGEGSTNQIKVRAFPAGGAEGDGFIVRQKGSKHFVVTVGGVTGLCTLCNKSNGSLVAGDMTITVADSSAGNHIVSKLTAHKATLADSSNSAAWGFAAATTSVDQVAETSVITISAQPADRTGIGSGSTTFAVTASASPTETLTYQWQSSTDGGTTWANALTANGYTNVTTATLGVTSGTGKIGNKYRCIITGADGVSVTSNAATLVS